MSFNQKLVDLQETIAAQASAAGAGARAVIRVTGPLARETVNKIFRSDDFKKPENQQSTRPRCYQGVIHSDEMKSEIPGALYWWPHSRSFTGQPVGEFHIVSSPPLINSVLQEMYQHGARPANPGEFTLRAFLNGKLDLLQAEAVLGVIDARTDQEFNLALTQLAGGLSTELHQLRNELLNDLADLEAGLDFVDEDLEFISRETLLRRINMGINLTEQLLEKSAQRMTSQALPRVVLAGLPNAGKSTLFNLLSNSFEAIVSPVKGTTRDYLSANVKHKNCDFILVDTAGLDEGFSGPDSTGQALGREQQLQANLVLWCEAIDLNEADVVSNQAQYQKLVSFHQHVVKVITKADTIAEIKDESQIHKNEILNSHETIYVSSFQPNSITKLLDLIAISLATLPQENQLLINSTAARCRDSLLKILEALNNASQMIQQGLGDEMVALEIRSTLESLGEITGEVHTNDLLDRIFSRFCIGK